MAEPLKNMFFTRSFVDALSAKLQKASRVFDDAKFKSLVFDDRWNDLELKQRMRQISHALRQTLPPQYPDALAALKKASAGFSGFDAMVFPDFVECYGLDNWELSLEALQEFTKLCSSEFAIRPFLKKDLHATLEWMNRWAGDEHESVRRLASEGCRPRLPWAMAIPELKKDPRPILPILEKLKDDPSETVRRSVANNINDISKDHPERALEVCRRWKGASAGTDRLIKHACRTLLKRGNPDALTLFGFAGCDDLVVNEIVLDKSSVKIGDKISFSFSLAVCSSVARQVRLEYKVFYIKKNGKASPKVFQVCETRLGEGVHTFSRQIDFQDLTTRKHNPGLHHVDIIANGIPLKRFSLELLEA